MAETTRVFMSIVKICKKLLRPCLPESLKIFRNCSREFKNRFGRMPNVLFPRTFNERVQHRKIFEHDPILPLRADKVLVKDFVTDKLGSQYVIPTIWHGKTLPPRAERNWPIPFVIKANHGSGWNIFVRTEVECDWDFIEQQCDDWLRHVHGQRFGEWLYRQIEPQILVEPFIGEMAKLPVDYKLWTFNGRVHFVEVITDRGVANKQVMYDIHWNRLPFTAGVATDPRETPKPDSLNEMIVAAEKLSEDISFVRVDFYDIHGQLLFGEMTFYPASGYDVFSPVEYDRKVGKLWK